MAVSELPASQTQSEPNPASETLLSFALAVAGQIEDRGLRAGLSAGLIADLDPELPKDVPLAECIAATCAAIESVARARLATRAAVVRSRKSLLTTRSLLSLLARGQARGTS
jgi:hypothetical protein